MYLKVFSIALMSISISAVAEPHKPGKAPIREEMGGLYAVTSELMPLVLDKAAFENKANSKEITTQMNKLQQLTRTMVSKSKRFEDEDPSIKFVSERFADDVQYAIDMWNTGDRVIPRRLLRNVTDYCISCHTRTSKGVHFSEIIQPPRFKFLPALTKAEYLAATRQFDAALKQYETVLVDRPLAKIDPQAWSQAVQKMLAITVRVQNNPSLTLEMISRIQDSPEAMPPNLRGDIFEWRKSAKAWAEEKQKKLDTEELRYAKVKLLLSEADEISKRVPGGALIQNLRASAILHDMLSHMHSGPRYQEFLWLAGTTAKALREFNLWTMQDIYFESCVRAGGDKALAAKCLAALETSTLEAYGVESKAGLPDFMRNRLENLKIK